MSDETTHSAVFEADTDEDVVKTGLSRGAPMSVLWWVESTADDLVDDEDAAASEITMQRLTTSRSAR